MGRSSTTNKFLVPLILGLCVLSQSRIAVGQSLGFAIIDGRAPKKTKSAVARGIRESLQDAEVAVIRGNVLRKTARRMRQRHNSYKVAKKAGADYLLRLKLIKKRRRRYLAYVRILDTGSGKVVQKFSKKFKASQALAEGRAIGVQIVSEIGQGSSTEVAKADASGDDDSLGAPPPVRVLSADDVEGAREGESSSAAESEEPGEGETLFAEEETKAETSAASSDSLKPGMFKLRAFLGTQLTTRNTVEVAGQATGLAYTMGAIPLFGVGVDVDIPDSPFRIDVSGSLASGAFNIDVTPAVTPTNPGAKFYALDALGAYDLVLSKGEHGPVVLSPVLGVGYRLASVETQRLETDMNVQNSVVLGWNAFGVRAGAKGRMPISASFGLAADAVFGYVLSYSETPNTTGDSGGGLQMTLGVGADYSIADNFGVQGRFSYEYQNIGFSGTGDRVRFLDDPELTDASVLSADAKLSLGAYLTF